MPIEPQHHAPAWWDRSRFRRVNGLGFAISSSLALLAVLGLLATLMPGSAPMRFTFPAIYAVVAFVALLTTVGIFAVLMFRFAWRGERFDTRMGRTLIYVWSLSGLLFFLCLALIQIRFDAPDLPNLPPWATDFLWFLTPFGILAHSLMSWTNSDLPHRDEYDDHPDEPYEELPVE